MKPPVFDYATPASLAEATALLVRHEGDAKVLSGGQSLVPLLNMRLARPAVLVDLARIPDLDWVRTSDDGIAIGAMTRQRTVELSAEVRTRHPLLHAGIQLIAHPQNRNQGTIGGSLAHADPAAELPALALALDARFEAVGPQGTRAIAAADFFLTYLTTALEPSEILTAVRFPMLPARTGWSIQEVARRHGDFALAGVVAVVGLAADGGIASARVVVFGVGATPLRALAAERLLGGQVADAALFARAGAQAAAEIEEPLTDVHASADYRRDLARVLSTRALAEARPGRAPPDPRTRSHVTTTRRIRMTVNGERHEAEVEPRTTLVDFLRGELGLTGTHVGCEHGVCGACTVLWNGRAVRSCIMLAVQADGAELRTVEGLADGASCTRSSRPSREARPAMRLLHAGLHDVGVRAAARARAAERRGDRRHARRSHLPLHRVPGDRRGGAARGREDAGKIERERHDDSDQHRRASEQRAALRRSTVDRLEDPPLLTGRTEFIDNVVLPRMLHCAILRSPHAHATDHVHRHQRGGEAARRRRHRHRRGRAALDQPDDDGAARLGGALPRDRQGALRRRAGRRGRGRAAATSPKTRSS